MLIVIVACFWTNDICKTKASDIIFISDHLRICTTTEEFAPPVFLSICFTLLGIFWHWQYNSLRNTMHADVKGLQDLMFFMFVLGWTIVTLYEADPNHVKPQEGIVYTFPNMNHHRFGVFLMIVSLILISVSIWNYLINVLHEDSMQTCKIFSAFMFEVFSVLWLVFVVCVGVCAGSCVYIMSVYIFKDMSDTQVLDMAPDDFSYVMTDGMRLAIQAEYIFTIGSVVFVFLSSYVCYVLEAKFRDIQDKDCFDTMASQCTASNRKADHVISLFLLVSVALIFIIFPIL